MKLFSLAIVTVLLTLPPGSAQRVSVGTATPYQQRMAEIREAIKAAKPFTIPGLESTQVFAKYIEFDDAVTLRVSGVILVTDNLVIEAAELEYIWDLKQTTLKGEVRVRVPPSK